MEKQWIEVEVMEKESLLNCPNGCQRSSGSPTGG